jgi:DnaJ-class molecular chaperone
MSNLYDILNVTKNATDVEIKNAYKKMLLKYHPDKNNIDDSTSKFIEIRNAYETLIDKQKRNNYDKQHKYPTIYDSIKSFCTNISPNYDIIINIIASKYYKSEDNLKDDINNMNFGNILGNIFNIDIINVYLLDKYNGYVNVNNIIIPLNNIIYNKKYIIKNKKIKFVYHTHTTFIEIDNKHLALVYKISLYKYLYGGNINIEHIDGEIINVEFAHFIDSVPIVEIKNKGLLYDNKFRGNLYIYFTIEGINDNINDEFSNKIKEILYNLFI